MVAASGFLGAGIQHRERKESDCSRRVGQRNQILHAQTQQRKYQWDICMHRTLCCQPAQHGGHATDISSSNNELYLVIGAFTAHHVLPAAISYPSDHWPASDDPCRILRVIDQDLVSAAANNKIKQSVLSKQSTSCKRRTGRHGRKRSGTIMLFLFLAGFVLLYSILPMSHHVIEEEGVKHMGDNLQAITWQEHH